MQNLPNIQPYYVTLCEFGDLGIGHACDPASFDEACDAYADEKAQGRDAGVFRIDPPHDGKAGMIVDETENAANRIRTRYRLRNADLPEWLIEQVPA